MVSAGVVLLSACNVTRDLPEGEYMLNRVKVVTDGKYRDVNGSAMKEYVRMKTNTRWLSSMKVPLGIYGLAGRDSSWYNRVLRTIGEAPVRYDSVQAFMSCEDLKLALQNKGYLDAEVECFADFKKRKVNAIYVLHPKEPYQIGDVQTVIEDSLIANMLEAQPTSLHTGMRFSAEALTGERDRMTSYLQNHGYFRFNKEYISYRAHKDEALHKVDLKTILHLYRGNDGADSLHSRFMIRHINYEGDAYGDSAIHLRRHVLHENTFLQEGQPYSAAALQNTYNHFSRLGAVKYTGISFEPVADTTLLDTKIQIQTNKPSTISFQPEGTNTAGDLGAAATLTYQNRNLFRGAEVLSVQLRGAYEAIRELEGYSNQDYFEYSLEGRLSFPRFIAPFLSSKFRRKIIGTSELSLLYDSQDRPEFHRRVLSAGWGYQWKPQNRHSSYRIDLIDLNYVFMPWISETFRREYLDNTSNSNVILRYNYEDLFIMRLGFGYTYNNGRLALKTNVESAGNLLDAYAHSFKAPKDGLGQYKVFDIAYAQYVKADFDLTRKLLGGDRHQLVFHAGFGIAYPYGNSRVLPFEKRYFAGGANSVRGWTVRSLGPGRYKDKDGRINFITQTGDMKLDLNMEYRTYLFWKFDGALFVDAGNIWTLRRYDEQPGGQFSFSRLIDDLAVGYGLGLRLNFSYFILRLDLGVKAVNPAFRTEEEAHFPIAHPDLNRDLSLHFAVGLPF